MEPGVGVGASGHPARTKSKAQDISEGATMAEIAWINTVEESEACGRVAEAYDRIADSKTGRVGHILKVSSLNPRAMVDHRVLYRTLMFAPSPLKRTQREMLGTVVSALNGCYY